MKICRKITAWMILMCLVISTVPAAMAVDTEVRMSAATNYSELEKMVATANGLNSYDYTIETWEPLEKAVKHGKQMLQGAHGQTVVDEAAAAIDKAMSGLVKMDYSALDSILADVYTELEKDIELYDVWYRITNAAEAARPLLVSGHQMLVNSSVEELTGLLAELMQYSSQEKEPEIVIQEVPVEILPTDDFCNIPMHHTWPVLFCISAVLNVGLLVALIYVIMKRRNTVDNTPLVNYDIDDDMEL